jgi:hypothetical protein
MRVHERGSGETRSCGTGTCAVALAATLKSGENLPARWTIYPPGGRLIVDIDGHSNATLIGPAELIREHDRVMMMGHGSPNGLFSIGKFSGANGLIIDHTTVSLLKEKDNSVFIWCWASEFVKNYKLSGFSSGMFISEVGEASHCSKYDQTVDDLLKIKLSTVIQEEVDESNYGFCNIIAKYINEDKELIHENVKKEYGLIAESNPVAFYNNNRLYKS